MTSKEIRQQFLDFFKNKEHKIVPSAPVVPFDDPTLLFTNAGMNQFKDVFLGTGKRDYKRAADTQKCIRVSGKHNDLEEVGHDTYHHTFFEMLGNWSFGDYYKAEAIEWAWELLTKVWKLPKERLWATVYKDDDESFEFWKSKTDINPKHVLKFGEKDNFWEMGETGPCGPCSEIHINLGDDYENPKLVNAGLPDCIEIWNLVFIQYNRDENGKLHDLPLKHVDTGMGFERVCAVLQKKDSNYDTDVFSPLIKEVEKISNKKYEIEEDKISMRVIADHIRTLTFAIADGAVPGNEGRGYVLRRILRRAARYGRKLDLHKPFLFKLVDVLVKTMSNVFSEIKEKKDYIKKVVKAEEESFNATLDRGLEEYSTIVGELFNMEITKIPDYTTYQIFDDNKKDWKIIVVDKNNNEIDSVFAREMKKDFLQKYNINSLTIRGLEAFKLYDTYGFPFDLTALMAREQGFTIDEERFNSYMEKQKQKSREATKGKFNTSNIIIQDLSEFNLKEKLPSKFTGYDELKSNSKVIGVKKESKNSLVVLDRTPFYVESGGQIDDLGQISTKENSVDVIDVAKVDNKIIHVVENSNLLKTGTEVIAGVDEKRRWDIMRNHTATHFLHSALRKILGTHVHQAGSYVGPDRLRFDFTHFQKLNEPELHDIESLVNEELRISYQLQHHRNIPYDEAKKMGALMFFGDKYGDRVNVVQYGEFTKEFCGGTHVKNSSQVGLFKIVNESSIASGVRRIEAVTGIGVEKYIGEQLLIRKKDEERIEELLDTKKKLEKEISELNLQDDLTQLDHILSLPSESKRIKIYKGKVHARNMDELKSFGDEMRNKIKSGVGVLVAQINDKVGIVAIVSDDLIKEKKLNAGKIVGELAKLVGGGGGGRPHLATAGGKDVSGIKDAIGKVEKIVGSFL